MQFLLWHLKHCKPNGIESRHLEAKFTVHLPVERHFVDVGYEACFHFDVFKNLISMQIGKDVFKSVDSGVCLRVKRHD